MSEHEEQVDRWVTHGGEPPQDNRLQDFAWSIDDRKDPEIVLACDASLDEGDAIIRATFAPGLGSDGSEYFVQVDRDEARTAADGIVVAAEGCPDASMAETLWRVHARLLRVLSYMEGDEDLSFLTDLQACEPESLTLGGRVRVEAHSGRDVMGMVRVDLVGPRDAIIEYVKKHWGTEDLEWFGQTVARIARVQS